MCNARKETFPTSCPLVSQTPNSLNNLHIIMKVPCTGYLLTIWIFISNKSNSCRDQYPERTFRPLLSNLQLFLLCAFCSYNSRAPLFTIWLFISNKSNSYSNQYPERTLDHSSAIFSCSCCVLSALTF